MSDGANKGSVLSFVDLRCVCVGEEMCTLLCKGRPILISIKKGNTQNDEEGSVLAAVSFPAMDT